MVYGDEDSLIKTNHHPNSRTIPHRLEAPGALDIIQLIQVRPHLGLQVFHLLGPEGKPPEAVDPGDGADEIRVAHVRQRAEMCLVSALVADLAPRLDPLPYLPLLGRFVEVVPRTFEVLERRLLRAHQGRLFVALRGHRCANSRIRDRTICSRYFTHSRGTLGSIWEQ